jgi:hypothetical protein
MFSLFDWATNRAMPICINTGRPAFTVTYGPIASYMCIPNPL